MRFAGVLVSASTCLASAVGPSVPLKNAANAGMSIPAIGLGTAGGNKDHGYGAWPECWGSCFDAECVAPPPENYTGCGPYVEAAQHVDARTCLWTTASRPRHRLQLGGCLIDDANGYHNQRFVGRAVRTSGVPRGEIFYQTKVGAYLPMGYQASMAQLATALNATGMGYFDLLMMHWPSCATGGGCGNPGADDECQTTGPKYNETACLVSSYRALVDMWKQGSIHAVGVSNFNISHLEAVQRAGLPLPALNQAQPLPYPTNANTKTS
eukprot:gene5414-5427_t